MVFFSADWSYRELRKKIMNSIMTAGDARLRVPVEDVLAHAGLLGARRARVRRGVALSSSSSKEKRPLNFSNSGDRHSASIAARSTMS